MGDRPVEGLGAGGGSDRRAADFEVGIGEEGFDGESLPAWGIVDEMMEGHLSEVFTRKFLV